MDEQPKPPPLPNFPPPPRPPGKWKKFLGPFAFIGVMLAKFKGVIFALLKFKFLLSGLSMMVSMGVYSLQYGWQFGVGLVLLIFVHEMGHFICAKQMGVNVSAPVFIPFVGAFILLRDLPRNPWVEATVAIAGPIAGALASMACYFISWQTGSELFGVLAYWGFMMNLFNLIPVGMLDGGRISMAISPLLWIIGFAIAAALLFFGQFNFILLAIVLMGIPRFWNAVRPAQDRIIEQDRLTPRQRATMGFLYFSLVAFLAFAVAETGQRVGPPEARATSVQ